MGPGLSSYDKIIVAFSGGKDSTACLLDLLERGVPKEKIELWHHDVDGREGSTLMDWPVTRDYCRKFAKALGIKLYFSWKQGGFEGEMLKDNQRTAPTSFETPDGVKSAGGIRGDLGTRLMFPQVSPDLAVRWCSSYLKICVCEIALRNQKRFIDKRTLVITGERAEESPGRAKYKTFEPHKADLRNGKRSKRHIDHWRNVHSWTEKQVWEIIERWKINVHPAYHLGWGRLSCMACIFGNKNQWASVRVIAKNKFNVIADYEKKFGVTIQRKESVIQLADKGTPYQAVKNLKMVRLAKSEEYTADIFIPNWTLPAGAYGDSTGPL